MTTQESNAVKEIIEDIVWEKLVAGRQYSEAEFEKAYDEDVEFYLEELKMRLK